MPAYYDERIKEGKVIKVQDVAFVTYVHSSPVPLADRPIFPVFKRFSSTYTRVVSNSLPSDPTLTEKPGLLKSSPSPQTTYPNLRQSPSTVLPIRYSLLRPLHKPPHLTMAT